MKYVFKSSDERNVGQTEACRPLSKKKKKRRGEEKVRRVSREERDREGRDGGRGKRKDGRGESSRNCEEKHSF